MVLNLARSFSPRSVSTPGSSKPPSDDFTMVQKHNPLPLRPRKETHVEGQATVEIHPLYESNAFIVSVQPPRAPEAGSGRASCDIVLVIDVSGSMSSAAPLPETAAGEDNESTGLSVLDLVKHAAITILETMEAGDRLGIVTFSNDATVRLPSTRWQIYITDRYLRWFRSSLSCLRVRRRKPVNES